MKITEPIALIFSLFMDHNPVVVSNWPTQTPTPAIRTVELPTGSTEAYMYENLRPDSRVIHVLLHGDQIEVLKVQSDAALIQFRGQKGYILLR